MGLWAAGAGWRTGFTEKEDELFSLGRGSGSALASTHEQHREVTGALRAGKPALVRTGFCGLFRILKQAPRGSARAAVRGVSGWAPTCLVLSRSSPFLQKQHSLDGTFFPKPRRKTLLGFPDFGLCTGRGPGVL